ncbi:MAG: M14 family metallocarboxypeptidase [Verrucomicrobiales bacterium]|nr:M14 family metallocarboxypeptidase [Verrucomicrobiales bacterium]
MNAASPIQRAGRNVGRYDGETIAIQDVLQDIQTAALKYGWRQDCFLKSEEFCLLAYHRATGQPRKRIYISSGIHGDEPAGPLAVRELVRQNSWPDGIDVWLCPCLNPTGFPINRRENARGLDLNRQYLHLEAAETKAHVLWLEQQPRFDVVLCLHEDWEAHGFYVYELNPDHQPSFAEEMIRRISEVCPIDRSPVIEGREAKDGIIRPSVDPRSRPQWPEGFYLLAHKTRLTYTLEAPSDYPMPPRVAALVTGVRTVLDLISK